MIRKALMLCGLLLGLSTGLQAQELQTSFERLEKDLYARTHERLDLNDVPCAVLRVSVPDAKEFTFSGNIIGDVIYLPGEAIVYMTAKSRKIHISSDKFGILDFEFPERLQKQVVYKLTLKIILSEEQKRRTLVMPVMGVNKTPSFGVMVGVVKKFGPYFKAKYDFKDNSTDLECNNEGIVQGGEVAGSEAWFTGRTKNTRMSLTVGGMMRLAMPLYAYAGTGYGYKTLAWETVDGAWAKNNQNSYKGLEFETGVIYRHTNYAASLGIQTNQFKFWEVNLGIGIMF